MMTEFDTRRYFDKKGLIRPEAFGLQYPCVRCELPTRFEEGLCIACTEKLITEIDEHEIGGIG